jgi:thiol-disulfide isomerase/thioredoxin
MKKLLVSLLLIAFTGGAWAQAPSVISGTWNKRTPRTIKLFGVEDGTPKEIAATNLGEDNKFYFAFSPEKEGFYVIALDPRVSSNSYTFYFKPGDQLNVVMNEDNSYALVGENTPENKEMARWHQFLFPVEDKAVYFKGKQSTYVDFFPLLNEKTEAAKRWKQDYRKNKTFNEAFSYYRRFDLAFMALFYLGSPRAAHPKPADLPEYYRQLSLPELTATDRLLDYPHGMDLIDRYSMAMFVYMPDVRKQIMGEANSFNPTMMLAQVTNEKIRGEQTLAVARNLVSFEAFDEFERTYGGNLVTDSQKARFKAMVAAVAENNPGQKAIDFRFADRTGTEIALSDFKGKVVYVDVWATWCGPCRAEFPHMKKLEAEYHGNDQIVFLGVSIDASRDKQKWLDFLDKEQLPGIQLFAGDKGNSEISAAYDIKSIPRFILVGKDGNLIYADAMRPSSNEIRTVLNNALGKK